MPAIKLSDAAISRITATDKTVWYSDTAYDGLRLAVGKKSKTFYYTKRHPDTKRVLTLMIGRYPATDYAHAKIKSIDTSEASHAPGVVAVYTGSDVAGKIGPVPCAGALPGTRRRRH